MEQQVPRFVEFGGFFVDLSKDPRSEYNKQRR